MLNHLLRFLLGWLIAGSVAADLAKPAAKDIAGSIEAEMDGQRVLLAALQSRYDVTVRGDVVNVALTQTFENPYSKPLNARYLFPLNKDAAVHAMTMYVGDEIIQARIQEKQQAQQTFKQAKQAGKAATLLSQHRPNMFTQKVANLMPGQPIKVVIEYTHLVPKVDGAFELVVPMVVGPRFQPAGAGRPPASGDAEHPAGVDQAGPGKWVLEQLPDYPVAAGVHVPATVVGERVSLDLMLETPLPLGAVSSDTHPLLIQDVSSTQQEIRFAAGKVLDNRDFVLRYQMAAQRVDAGLLSHWQSGEGGYFSLLIEPPADLTEASIVSREMVFLLDCSGSMSGAPMQASKAFMLQALRGLRADDTFRIIRFSDAATEFSTRPLPATPANIAAGIAYTRGLYGSGGTMMSSGIRQALSGAMPADVVRNVVFLTDGYIGNEASVLELVEQLRGDTRLFAFGVGSGVNRYLLSELGRVGHGFTRYFDPTRDAESTAQIAAQLAARLQTPVLTNLHIDWGALPVTDVLPRRLPDLYAGDTLRVTGRFTQPAAGNVLISGRSRGQAAQIKRAFHLGDGTERSAIRRVWARTAIAEHMHSFITPMSLRRDGISNSRLQAAVTELGLSYGLATRWTSFVAVSRRVYNADPATNADADVALPQVAGVSQHAYSQPALTGFGTPEPGMLLGLLTALLAIFTFRYWRRALRWGYTPKSVSPT